MTELEVLAALLDTNILYPAGMRDIFIQLAVQDMYRPKWSADIFREWMRIDRRNNRKHDPAKVLRTQQQLNALDFAARIDHHQYLINDLVLPDLDDRHVLAAAIRGECDVIVTQNLKHFPDHVMEQYDIRALNADSFLQLLLETNTSGFLTSVRAILEKLNNPPLTLEKYLALRQRDGLEETVKRLRQYAHLLE